VGSRSVFDPTKNLLSSLGQFIEEKDDWIFGHFNYECKIAEEGIEIETRADRFPSCFLFVPEIVVQLELNKLTIGVVDREATPIFSEITSQIFIHRILKPVQFKQRMSREVYLNNVRDLKKHIQQGDCYEINFCQQFYACTNIDPVSTYSTLGKSSPNPFSAFYRVHDNYLMCASPERYLKKAGKKMVSQPIKGTAARSRFDADEDQDNKRQLQESEKERSENVMIVDLVRNDLSKICEEGSVKVEELFGIYSFPNVHQMISTVVGELRENTPILDALKATFPMGSMTGAPKRKVMELIEKYEHGKRGIYSGTVGYISPEKDFDFNVVIRSVVYNETTRQVSFHTGGAITALSNPEKEYEECLLKAEAIVKAFT
jgi:para-aminobenzoate synthetase component 1